MAERPIEVKEFDYPIDEELATELASVCREEFEPSDFEDHEDWSHLLTIRGGDGKLVAFLLLNENPVWGGWEKEGNVSVVQYICASVSGHADRLFKKAEEIARNKGKKQLGLEANNSKLATLYESKYKFTPDTNPLSRHMKRPIPPAGGLRLNKKGGRTKRNGRGRKGRKLRKLTTRRR